MRKIIPIILCVFLMCSCGCQNKSIQNENYQKVTVSNSADGTVNGYKNPYTASPASDSSASSTIPNGQGIYYANTSSKKFHLSSCSTTTRMKQENLLIANDREQLINDGYSPCAKCKP